MSNERYIFLQFFIFFLNFKVPLQLNCSLGFGWIVFCNNTIKLFFSPKKKTKHEHNYLRYFLMTLWCDPFFSFYNIYNFSFKWTRTEKEEEYTLFHISKARHKTFTFQMSPTKINMSIPQMKQNTSTNPHTQLKLCIHNLSRNISSTYTFNFLYHQKKKLTRSNANNKTKNAKEKKLFW